MKERTTQATVRQKSQKRPGTICRWKFAQNFFLGCFRCILSPLNFWAPLFWSFVKFSIFCISRAISAIFRLLPALHLKIIKKRNFVIFSLKKLLFTPNPDCFWQNIKVTHSLDILKHKKNENWTQLNIFGHKECFFWSYKWIFWKVHQKH